MIRYALLHERFSCSWLFPAGGTFSVKRLLGFCREKVVTMCQFLGPGKQETRSMFCFPPGLLSVHRHLETSLSCMCPWDCLNHGRDENNPWPPAGPRRTFKKMHGHLCSFPCCLPSSGLPNLGNGTSKYRLQVWPSQWLIFFLCQSTSGR